MKADFYKVRGIGGFSLQVVAHSLLLRILAVTSVISGTTEQTFHYSYFWGYIQSWIQVSLGCYFHVWVGQEHCGYNEFALKDKVYPHTNSVPDSMSVELSIS